MTPQATSTAASARSLAGLVSRIHARGWCEGTAGNFSVCVSRDPVRLLITPSGLDKGKLTPDDLLLVGPHGRPVDGAAGKPSAETALHLAVREASGAGAILHTHSVWNTLLGENFLPRGELRLTGYEMLKGIEGIDTHSAELVVPIVENSQDVPQLAEAMQLLIRKTPDLRGLLIAGHGLYAWGRSLDQAYRHLEIFEFLFELAGRRVPLVPFKG